MMFCNMSSLYLLESMTVIQAGPFLSPDPKPFKVSGKISTGFIWFWMRPGISEFQTFLNLLVWEQRIARQRMTSCMLSWVQHKFVCNLHHIFHHNKDITLAARSSIHYSDVSVQVLLLWMRTPYAVLGSWWNLLCFRAKEEKYLPALNAKYYRPKGSHRTVFQTFCRVFLCVFV